MDTAETFSKELTASRAFTLAAQIRRETNGTLLREHGSAEEPVQLIYGPSSGQLAHPVSQSSGSEVLPTVNWLTQ